MLLFALKAPPPYWAPATPVFMHTAADVHEVHSPWFYTKHLSAARISVIDYQMAGLL